MSRIFAILAIVASFMMGAALMLGSSLGDLKSQLLERKELSARLDKLQSHGSLDVQQSHEAESLRLKLAKTDQLRPRFRAHMWLGIASALTVILVNSIGVTYFIGTGRWCREVTEAYQFDSTLLSRSQKLKRRSFPWAVLGMLSVLTVSALGAAADPGTLRSDTEFWVTPHLVAAWVGAVLVGLAFVGQWVNLVENHMLIDQMVAEVGRVRRQRGLQD